MIKCNNWILIEKYKKEREEYEEYVSRINKEKILFAKSKLDEKDIEILKMINKLKITTSNQLAKIIYKNSKFSNRYINNKLNKLFKLGCIDRFFPAKDKGSYPVHVVLAKIGAKILNIESFRIMTVLNQKWKHKVAINEVLAEILYKYKVKICRFEMWVDKDKTRTDMFVIWVKENKVHAAFFEIDMGTENLKEVENKIKKYINYFKHDSYKTADWQPYLNKNISITPKIFFIFNNEERKQKFKKILSKYNSTLKFEVENLNDLNL
jgi:hypothetical protein